MATLLSEPAPRYKAAATELDKARATPASLLDVNVLIALLDSDHLHHRRASAWLSAHLDAGWASCAITQNGCVRIMSQPAYPGALPAARVAERLREATDTQHHRFLAETPSLLDRQHFDTERLLGHAQVTDAYLLGLALANGLRLVTFDARVSLAVVRGAAPGDLLVL